MDNVTTRQDEFAKREHAVEYERTVRQVHVIRESTDYYGRFSSPCIYVLKVYVESKDDGKLHYWGDAVPPPYSDVVTDWHYAREIAAFVLSECNGKTPATPAEHVGAHVEANEWNCWDGGALESERSGNHMIVRFRDPDLDV